MIIIIIINIIIIIIVKSIKTLLRCIRIIILLHEKFLQFDWLRAPTCENYKPFAGSSINK